MRVWLMFGDGKCRWMFCSYVSAVCWSGLADGEMTEFGGLVYPPSGYLREAVETILLMCVKVGPKVLVYILPNYYMLSNPCVSDLTQCTIKL